MRQHPIDLLPDSIRARGQARTRTGRYITAGILSVVVVVLAATHARLGLARARDELATAREQADLVLNAEAKATELNRMIADDRQYIDQYDRMALPLDLSAVIATVINRMPEGMTLDRIDVDAGARRLVRTSRSKGESDQDQPLPRILTAELSGFAPNDQRIAEFVAELEQARPFRNVSLDFSRTRILRGLSAREFRLSFRIDLDVSYEIVDELPHTGQLALEEADHE